MNIKLSKPQSDLITSTTTGTIFLSCIGGGKSYSLVLKAILNGLQGIRTLFISYSVGNLKDNIVPVFYEIFKTLNMREEIDYKIVKNPHITVTIKGLNGKQTEVLLRTGAFPDRLRGLTVGSFIIDEARELYTREIFDICIGRLRQKDIPLQWAIGTTTRSKDWVYDMIEEADLLSIFEGKNRLVTNNHLTVIRTTIDEVPHLSNEYVINLKRTYSSRFAQQELYAMILDDKGEIISPEWFGVNSAEAEMIKDKGRSVRYWDLAVSTTKAADYSCGCLMSMLQVSRNQNDILHENFSYAINNMIHVKMNYPDLKRMIIDTALRDGKRVPIVLEKAGQQTAIIDDLKRCPELIGYKIHYLIPVKDKITRAYPWASAAENGCITLTEEEWNKELFNECSKFSYESVKKNTSHDDMIDSISGAFEYLNRPKEVLMTRFATI